MRLMEQCSKIELELGRAPLVREQVGKEKG